MAEQLDSQAAVVSPVNVQEFSKKVKEKYPEYKDVDDLTLAKKIVEKYPEYKDKVLFDQPETTGTPPPEQATSQSKQPLTYMEKILVDKGYVTDGPEPPVISASESLHSSLPYVNVDKKQVVPSIPASGEDVAYNVSNPIENNQEVTPIPEKPKEERGYASKLGGVVGNELMTGLNQLNSWVADAPNFIYDLAGAPFRAVGLNVPTHKDFKDTPLQNISKFYKDNSKAYEEKVKALNPSREKGIVGAFQQGDIKGGFMNLAGSIAESTPSSIAMMLAGGATMPTILGGAAVFGAGKAQEIDENSPEMNYDLGRVVAAVNGTFEGIFETYLGSGAVAKSLAGIVKREGKDVAQQQIKTSLRDGITKMLTENPWLAPFGEGFEEVGTQLAQNVVDKYSGYKPDLNIMDGVGDSFIAGFGMGGIHGAVIGLAKKTMEERNSQPITTATIEGQQYTVNNPEDLGIEGKPIFAKDADGNIKAVPNHKVTDPITQTQGEIDQAQQQVADQQALMNGIADPNAQVIKDETYDEGARVVDFSNGQTKIIYNGQEVIAKDVNEKDAILNSINDFQKLPEPKVTNEGQIINAAPERKVITQTFGSSKIDIIENEDHDEVVPSDKMPLEKALPIIEKKFKDNKKFKVVAEKAEIEEPGETKYDDPVKKTVVKSIKIVPIVTEVSKNVNIENVSSENISENSGAPTENQEITNVVNSENEQINQLQNEKPLESYPTDLNKSGEAASQGEDTAQAQQGQGNTEGLEENVNNPSKENIDQPKAENPPVVKSLTVDSPAEVIPELTEEQKASTHNKLIDLVDNYNSIPNNHVNKKRIAFQQIQAANQRLGYSATNGSDGKIEIQVNGKKIQRVGAKQTTDEIQSHKSLIDYSEPARQFVQHFLDNPAELYGLDVHSSIKLSEQGIKNIREGKKTVAHNEVLDSFEKMFNDGVVRLKGMGDNEYHEIPIDEYFATINEQLNQIDVEKELGSPSDVDEWLDEKSNDKELEPTDIEEIDNEIQKDNGQQDINPENEAGISAKDSGNESPKPSEKEVPGNAKEQLTPTEKEIQSLQDEKTKLITEKVTNLSKANARNGLFGDLKAESNDLFKGEGFDAAAAKKLNDIADQRITTIDQTIANLTQKVADVKATAEKENAGQQNLVIPQSENKEPWQMTKKEYAKAKKEGIFEDSEAYHFNGIVTALREGKPVPAEVLNDYSELKKVEKVDRSKPLTEVLSDGKKEVQEKKQSTPLPEEGEDVKFRLAKEQSQKFISAAKKHFGTTRDFREAGYLLQDGSMLDFSGKKEGGPSGVRYMDHREINAVDDFKHDVDMLSFMKDGNIRIMIESGGFELTQEPTKEQLKTLRGYIQTLQRSKDFQGVMVDYSNPGESRTLFSTEYGKSVQASRILNDILNYYQKGVKPIVSDSMRFRIIGEKGAASLDREEEATTRLDNLRVAREMESSGKDAKTIRLATGWEKGADGKWRHEVPDDIKPKRNINKKTFEKAVESQNKINELNAKHDNDTDRENLISDIEKLYTELGSGLWIANRDFHNEVDKAFKNNDPSLLPEPTLSDNISSISSKMVSKEALLEDVIDNEQMYKEHPFLRYVGVKFAKIDSRGSYSPSNESIILSDNLKGYDNEIKSTLAHEIQHAIQYYEGFAKGGNTNMALKALADQIKSIVEAKPEYQELQKTIKEKSKWVASWSAENEKIVNKAKAQLNNMPIREAMRMLEKGNITDAQYEAYRRLSGEVEARNVQTRLNMTPEERRNTLLQETEDVSREDQVVLMDVLDKAYSIEEKSEKGQNVNITDTASTDLSNRPNVVKALDKISSELGEPVHIINSSEIPSAVEGLKKQITKGNRVPAFFYNGQIFLISDQITSVSDALKSYLHELIVHKGLREVFAGANPASIIGKQYAKFNDLMTDVFGSMSRSQKIDIASKYVPGLYNQNGKIMRNPTPAEKALIGEEFLAHVSENQEIYDEPTLTKWQQFINRLLQLIRKAFRLTSNQFSQKDLLDIVRQQRERLRNKAKGTTQAGTPDSQLRVSPETYKVSDNGFYSPTEKALNSIQQNKGSVEQFKAMLLKNGAKQAEMDWMGFDDQFPDGKQSVTKQDIQDWIDQNKIEVKEVTKGGSKWDGDSLMDDGEEVANVIENEDGTWSFISDFSEGEEYFESKDRAKLAAEQATVKDIYAENGTKFSQYTEPGGENYKELLLTLPSEKMPARPDDAIRIERLKVQRIEVLSQEQNDVNKQKLRDIDTQITILSKRIDPSKDFRSSHYDEPNILAHIRFNERARENGERVLFVEEFQSDWAQKGKKEGFKVNPTAERKVEIEKRLSEINKEKIGLKDAAKYRELETETIQLNSEFNNMGVPSMPFSKTDQWVNLSLRRMMRYAAENGFDRIAWTNGEMQAARYDLSKQIGEVRYFKSTNPKSGYDYNVVADDLQGRQVFSKELKENEIEDNLGKEIAKKIINDEGSPVKYGVDNPMNKVKEEGKGTLSGLDLAVGGEGMKAFYDAIIPSAANKLGKPFGARVENTEIKTTENPYGVKVSTTEDVKIYSKQGYTFKEDGKTVSKQRAYELIENGDYLIAFKNNTSTVQSLPVTESMKRSTQEGMPLFRVVDELNSITSLPKSKASDLLKSVNETVEANMAEAHGIKATPLWERIKAKLVEIKESTQHFKHITEAEFPVVYDKLRQFEAIPDRVKKEAYERMGEIIRPISKNKEHFEAFERYIVLQDLVNDIENTELFANKDLPWGYETVDEIKTDMRNVRTYVMRNPAVLKAVRDRQAMMKEVKQALVSNKLLKDNGSDKYFHHQVLAYMEGQVFPGVSSKDVRNNKKGWQRSRIGSIQAYNTNYIESEFEVLAQSLEQVAIKNILGEIGLKINIMAELINQAKNEGGKWRDYIPEGYKTWYPKQGTNAYKAASMAEKAVQNILKDPNSPDVAEQIAEVEGSMWVIPSGVADQFDAMKTPEKEIWFPAALRTITGKWKQWILLNPFSAIKYNFNNASGDIDVVLAYDPTILKPKYAKTATTEAWNELRGKGMSSDMKEALQYGIITSGLSIQEIPDVNQQTLFKSVTKGSGNIAQKLWGATGGKYWSSVTNLSQFRENTLRLASYKFFKEQIEAGKTPFGASDHKAVQALYDENTNPKEIAAKLARELMGDYGNLSQAGQWLRAHSYPFWSWVEINSPRYYRLLKNTKFEDNTGSIGRVAAVGAAKTAFNIGKLGVKAMLLMGLVVLWNRLMFPDEDDELQKQKDHKLKLIVGRREDGSIMTMKIQGAFSDVLSFFGLEDVVADVSEVSKGKSTVGKKAKEGASAFVNKFSQGAMPLTKTLAEVITKKSFYPDILNPRPVRDRAEQGLRIFKMDKIYNYLTHKPARAFGKEVSGLLVYDNSPGEASYYTMRQNIFDFMKDNGEEFPSGEPTNRSNALYYYKQSLKFGDTEKASFWFEKYKELGGTGKGYNASMKKGMIINTIPNDLKAKWFKSLDADDKEVLDMANKWYFETYLKVGIPKKGAK